MSVRGQKSRCDMLLSQFLKIYRLKKNIIFEIFVFQMRVGGRSAHKNQLNPAQPCKMEEPAGRIKKRKSSAFPKLNLPSKQW